MNKVLIPYTRFLSNGSYFVFISAAGTGQSRRHGHVVNRWTGDVVEDSQGSVFYLRDLDSGVFWSVGFQPVQNVGSHYEATSSPGSFKIIHENEEVRAIWEITVSPGENCEIHRLQLQNLSGRPRRIEVTSYLEVVLNYQGADVGHQAFSKLFVQTDYVKEQGMLVAERRPRANGETWPVVFQALIGAEAAEWETDRLRFLGRGRTQAAPLACTTKGPLSGTVGNVLDPSFSLRTVVSLAGTESRTVSFVTGLAETREKALAWVESYRSPKKVETIRAEAEAAELRVREQLKISPDQADKFQDWAAVILYGQRKLRRSLSSGLDLQPGRAEPSRFHVPRDRPTVVIRGEWDQALTQEIVQARAYWGTKGFYTNLVLLLDGSTTLPEGLDDRVFFWPMIEITRAELDILFLASSVVVEGQWPEVGALQKTVDRSPRATALQQRSSGLSAAEPLQFFNGYGGFSEDGKEYVIRLPWLDGELKRPPLPWINVIANEKFGFLTSETGAGCTWARNSQANRLTPWSNEPVADPHGEALYVRDEETGKLWSPLPGPAPAPCGYETRHGFGYSQYRSVYQRLQQEVTAFVARLDPVKITRVRLTNGTSKSRRLSLVAYQRLVMGSLPEHPSLIVTWPEKKTGTLRASNMAAHEFRGGLAFSGVTVSGAEVEKRYVSGDRLALVGRHGTMASPAGLQPGQNLDDVLGAGLDPCFAQQMVFTLEAGASAEFAILLGEGLSETECAKLCARYQAGPAIDQALHEAKDFWQTLVTGIQIKTPSPAIDLMVNGWLAYQTLSCRMWGRTAFYQSSGAYGYRDQLQDSAAMLPLRPEIVREQILLHARHQFLEGDILHWWHPEPIERGLRTKFSDDLLWLPFITSHYVKSTGDEAFLSTVEPWLTAPILREGEDEVYLKPALSGERADLYEHCCRAMDRSLTRGAHGLPLMGTGDWNDGMNRVGREGRGESVWLGFFLHVILTNFLPLCVRRGDTARMQRYEAYRSQLALALNDTGWDGEWYRRAYYDNGDPLGSKENEECRIDALAQAWAIISKVAPPEKADAAMASLARELICESDRLIRLLAPPFVHTKNDPGYIKGYVAGVRENGGQYTHAASWVVRAVAEHGQNNRAARLLEMLMPISHARTESEANHYKVEPFAVAADIYGAPPHVGRGGWTWYTGSCGWLYRVAIESILGLTMENGQTLILRPCVPDDWPEFRMTYRPPESGACYEIAVQNPSGRAKAVVAASLDDQVLAVVEGAARIPMTTDSRTHQVRIVLG
jgi:cyclic beta-1,2-glucan synthetase